MDMAVKREVDKPLKLRRSCGCSKESLTLTLHQRKARNRATQRACRERTDRHIRNLEIKLSALEKSTQLLRSENERLRLALQGAYNENRIMHATYMQRRFLSRLASVPNALPGTYLPDGNSAGDDCTVQPSKKSSVVKAPDQVHATSGHGRQSNGIPAARAEDLIQAHPFVNQGLGDIEDLYERLKRVAKFDRHDLLGKVQFVRQSEG
ncbi:hypothetical protein ACET3X_008774 [Alternaria dauci]|uniref:BZIP domain-containing protein n=1 Tax=Alternaria dauci TaxID=48095 RepID=A0ABR3UBB4_9PLEO